MSGKIVKVSGPLVVAEGMADALRLATESSLAGESLTERLGEFSIDKDVRKVRIHYSAYLGDDSK